MGGAYYEQSARQLADSPGAVGGRMTKESDMAYVDDRGVTGWAGWAAFAGVIMVMTGIFQATAGLVGLLNDDVYLVASDQLTITMDYTAWGWTHLILGSIVAAAGFAVFSGRVWARLVGVLLAALSALAHLLFISAFPFWTLIIVSMDVLVIYALTIHGGELRE
jgi:hypothetical protein